ncbi:hypothetical protein RhiirA5_435937 [Rhizophagus irregularis]|uniref:Uncharacterized protein n=1 Tax=Rhizophagus irregularis TaxID=588596 RepID=A0A2N0NMR4_9GLOM|nr:hypothetical protein RhiirA5_435937 [Rhizophagus irregularis]
MSPEKLNELNERKKKHEKKCEEEKDREKELYSKECIAHCINFVVGEARDEVADLKIHDRFSCYLATILARDKEVIAVWLNILKDNSEIYLSKNFDWLNKDVKYIDDITNYLKVISKNAPMKSADTEKAFIWAVMTYCNTKFEFRWDKLKNDIKNGDNEHVKSLKDYISANLGDSAIPFYISRVCYEHYKQIKAKVNSNISPKFLGHIKKVGSYYGSIKGIIACAMNIQYKPLFSNIKVNKGRPVIIDEQPIYSWKNIIKRFIGKDEDKYNCFMAKCSKKPKVMERICKVYTDNATKQLQLNNDNVEKCIYLHAEMHILASLIIDNDIKKRDITSSSPGNMRNYMIDRYFRMSLLADSDSGGKSPNSYDYGNNIDIKFMGYKEDLDNGWNIRFVEKKSDRLGLWNDLDGLDFERKHPFWTWILAWAIKIKASSWTCFSVLDYKRECQPEPRFWLRLYIKIS